MLEIVILPYMAVSFAIGWAIFSPFSTLEELDSLSFARLETVDLISCFIPLSFLLAIATWAIPFSEATTVLLPVVVGVAIVFTIFSLAASLYLLSKIELKSSLRRMAVGGVVVPFGLLMAIAWIAVPLWAFSYSILYSMPATLAVAIATVVIRRLSVWVCEEQPRIQ